jgi:hypothetical protein
LNGSASRSAADGQFMSRRRLRCELRLNLDAVAHSGALTACGLTECFTSKLYLKVGLPFALVSREGHRTIAGGAATPNSPPPVTFAEERIGGDGPTASVEAQSYAPVAEKRRPCQLSLATSACERLCRGAKWFNRSGFATCVFPARSSSQLPIAISRAQVKRVLKMQTVRSPVQVGHG